MSLSRPKCRRWLSSSKAQTLSLTTAPQVVLLSPMHKLPGHGTAIKRIPKKNRCQALITGVPGFLSHPRQPPEKGAGLLQLHSTAQTHRHEPKYISKNQHPTMQLQAAVEQLRARMAQRMHHGCGDSTMVTCPVPVAWTARQDQQRYLRVTTVAEFSDQTMSASCCIGLYNSALQTACGP